MFRYIAILIVGAGAIANVDAGQIQIGQVITGVNDGLTTTYVTSGCAGGGSCIAGSAGSFSERAYDANLFSAATPAPVSPSPFSGYSNTAGTPATPGSTMFDSTNQ